MNHRTTVLAIGLAIAANCAAGEVTPIKPTCTLEPSTYALLPPCRAAAGTGIRITNDGVELSSGQAVDFADSYEGVLQPSKRAPEYVWARVRGEAVLIEVRRP